MSYIRLLNASRKSLTLNYWDRGQDLITVVWCDIVMSNGIDVVTRNVEVII